MKQLEEISRADIAFLVSNIASVSGRLEAEDRMTDKDFDQDIKNLDKSLETLLELVDDET